jgi:hypothetical protein
MPAASSFIDTNILIYAISTDPQEAAKAAAAFALMFPGALPAKDGVAYSHRPPSQQVSQIV